MIFKTLSKHSADLNEIRMSTFTRLYQFLIDQVRNSLDMLQDHFENIVDAILFAELGQIHPSLLSPARLKEAVIHFLKHQRSSHFPIPIDDLNPGELAEISTITIGYHKEKLIFVITVPLIEPNIFHVYHLHPYPTPQQLGEVSGSAYIQPKAQYLVMAREM